MWSASQFSCFIHNNRISIRRGKGGVGAEPVWMPWRSENYMAHTENLTEFFWIVLCCVSLFPSCAILSTCILFQYSIPNRVIRFEEMVSNFGKCESKTNVVLKTVLLEVNLFSVETSINK